MPNTEPNKLTFTDRTIVGFSVGFLMTMGVLVWGTASWMTSVNSKLASIQNGLDTNLTTITTYATRIGALEFNLQALQIKEENLRERIKTLEEKVDTYGSN